MKQSQKLEQNKADQGRKSTGAAAKAALAILGVGFVAGTTLVVGLDRVMKKIFVDEKWPDEEWSSDDWAEEDLDN